MSAKRTLRVAVVGCGSAGPAAATLLARQGHEVVLLERAPECRAVGAGFLLQPSGMGVLEELGILEEVLERGSRVERLRVVTAEERRLLELSYAELEGGLYGVGLHRPVLLHFLMGAMERERVEVRWGWEVAGVSRRGDGWMLERPDGTREGGFDLLVVADGARSALRRLLGFGGRDRGYAWGAHWFIAENRGAFPTEELYQVVKGTRRLAGFLATGRAIGGMEPLVSLFWSMKVAEDEAWRSRPLEEWKDGILKVCPRAGPVLEQIGDWSQVLTARYGDVRMRSWHGEGVVLLGDAGHAMSPQLGQGVNLALADAACLAECVERFPLQEALRRYSRRRRLPLGYYGFATRALTPWFQSDLEWLSPARAGFFGLAGRVPMAKRLMTRTMAGLMMTGR